MSQAALVRGRAEELAAALPPLMAEADHLAATVLLGAHGRRRSGMGDEFWQYRSAHAGDEARAIDWRRSARSDAHFVREKEWQAAQSVHLWIDNAMSMDFRSDENLPTKADRAQVLALSTAILLVHGGERVGMPGLGPPRSGDLQLNRIATALLDDHDKPDFGAPNLRGALSHSRAVFFSDFLADPAPMTAQLTAAADRGIKGAIVQILDPQEEEFPFRGRTIFESMGRTLVHETLKANELRDRYLERLAERKDQLTRLARRTGWAYHCQHTSDNPQSALLWIYQALESRH